MFIINGATYGIFAPLWGVLCDRFVLPRRIVGFGSLLTVTAFLLVGPVPFIPLKMSLPLCIGALLLHGIGFGAELVGTFSGTQRTALKNGFPDNINTYGLVSGIWTSTFALGAFLGPTLAGYLYDLVGFPWASVVVVAMHGLLFFLTGLMESCTCCRRTSTYVDTEPLLPKKSRTISVREDHSAEATEVLPAPSPPTTINIIPRGTSEGSASLSRSYHAVASGLGSFTQPLGMTPRYMGY